MNKSLVFASLLSLGLVASPAAMAKPDKHQDRSPQRSHEYQDRQRNDHRESRWHSERQHHWQGDRYHVSRYQAPRGYKRHHWRYGERVPVSYRSSRYVVHDYRAYRLYAPPRHHHWVRVDNDVVLAAIASGVVTAVVYDLFQ